MKNPALQFVRGGQIFLYTTKMMIQVIKRIFLWSLFGFTLLFIGLLFYSSHGAMKILAVQYYSEFLSFVGLENKPVWSTLTAKQYLLIPKIQQAVVNSEYLIIQNTISALITSTGIYLILIFIFTKFFFRKGEKYSEDKFVSGTKLAKNTKEVTKAVKALNQGASNILLFNKIPIPNRSELQGFLFHGSTGAGKTQAIMHLLEQIKKLGEPAIIYDKECTIKPYFFNEKTDFELNPISNRCVNWDLWAECTNRSSLDTVAEYLIPKSLRGSDPFWVDAARTIFADLAWKIKDNPKKNVVYLLSLLLTLPIEEMHTMLDGTAAQGLISPDNAKVALSIKAIVAAYTKSLRFLDGLDDKNNPKFSIQQWVDDVVTNKKSSWLFITSRAKYHKSIKPLLSLWLGLAMCGIQNLPANSGKRIWLVMDELASLHHLDMLSETLADIRKFGGCVAIGIQSISQLQFLYGDHEAMAIADLLNTSVYFRSPKARIAKWVSEDLGEQIFEEVRESQSYGPNSIRDGNTIGSQRVIRKTVEAASIMQLDDLNCYVKLLGSPPIAKICDKYRVRPQISEILSERILDFDALEKINIAAKKIHNNPEIEKDVKDIQAYEKKANLIATQPDLLEKKKLAKKKKTPVANKHVAKNEALEEDLV